MKALGKRIKQVRKEKKMTLRVLSKKINVSASFLSQIETGKAAPSVATLKSIADTLQTTIGALIGEKSKSGRYLINRKTERDFVKKIGNGIKICVLTSHDPYKLMEPLLTVLDKGANFGDVAYKHYGQEFGFVLKGSLEVTINEKKYILKEGDTIYFNSNEPHSFRNNNKGTTEMLWVVTPPSF